MPDDLNPAATPVTPAQPESAPSEGVVPSVAHPASPVTPPVSSWPSDWRESFAKNRNDEKLATRLSRYASPEAALDALISVQNKISAGELRSNTPFPDKGTPEEQAKWRQSVGVPEAPDKYEIQLGEGLVIGEEDKPLVDSFLKASHAANLKPAEVNSLLKWYFDEVVEGQQAARFDADEKVREQVDEQLRTEWGQDYRKNKAIIEAYLDSGPPGVKDMLFGARLADGTPLASNLEVLRFLADKGREFNPIVSLVPQDPTTAARTIADEKITLMNMSKAPKGSPEWNKYWKQGGEARYRELVDAENRIKERQNRAA